MMLRKTVYSCCKDNMKYAVEQERKKILKELKGMRINRMFDELTLRRIEQLIKNNEG